MFRIMKEFHFSASHQLDHLPAEHQCARLHGHNYIVVVELAGERLNADGFVPAFRVTNRDFARRESDEFERNIFRNDWGPTCGLFDDPTGLGRAWKIELYEAGDGADTERGRAPGGVGEGEAAEVRRDEAREYIRNTFLAARRRRQINCRWMKEGDAA